MEAVKWNRATSKREQGVITPKRPKSKRQLKAALRIVEKQGKNEREGQAPQ